MTSKNVSVAEKSSVALDAVSPVDTLGASVERMTGKLRASLPYNIDVDFFIRTALIGIQFHKDVNKILGPRTNRRSIFIALERAAIDGLLLDGREAVLVPFKNNTTGQFDVSYIPMYQGLLKLARQSGEILDVFSEVVYERDSFRWIPGVDPHPVHEPDWFAEDRGAPIGAWAMVRTKDGGNYVSVMSRRTILGIGRRARNNADQYDPKTGASFTEWWKKTALRRVLKTAPRGRPFQPEASEGRFESALTHDEEADQIVFSPIDQESGDDDDLQSDGSLAPQVEGPIDAIMAAVVGSKEGAEKK